ncbi:MAG: flagellar protein FlgN [Pseudomonadota bacterium]
MLPKPSKLASQLSAENAAWAALLGTLADEERALIDGDADRLAALNATKLERLHAASELARARMAALADAGFPPSHSGMENWLARHGNAAARADWHSLRTLEDQARASNLRIGKLIEMRMSATRQALNVLMHAATGKGGLYDPSGQAVAAHASKPLTAA